MPDLPIMESTSPNKDARLQSSWTSPLCDESVAGFPGEKLPPRSGANEILEVVAALERADIPCCSVGEAALVYFGAKRQIGVC